MFDQLKFINKVYQLNRTLVSDDTDKTLEIIGENLPKCISNNYRIVKIPSGTKCWTWTVPKKYIVKEAYIKDEKGNEILNFRNNPLHLVSYSKSINTLFSFEELDSHLFYTQKRPDAIPWKFYYYKDDWGFCLPFNSYKNLDRKKKYQCVIDVDFKDDFLKIGELVISGKSKNELLIVTNICHPFQVNDSITGVSSVLDVLHKMNPDDLNISLRILFLPETIGSICYFAENEGIEKNIKFGLFTEMLGNNNSLALQKSYEAETYIDKVAEYVMKNKLKEFRTGNFREMAGNDELVTNGPGLNIPTISITRSAGAFKCYPEYHTSDDNPSILLKEKLNEAAELIKEIIEVINSDYYPKRKFKGPAFLSGYGLWGIWGNLENGKEYVDKIMYLLEGNYSVFEISQKVDMDYRVVLKIINEFKNKSLIDKVN
jgi:aminopeptidase-like protein